ncbi:conserved hypothetical protein [Aspergillus terreus NIH2624]|uniref:Uncharacterized protein n=1 Tax=Aspergillus terreus (strain NIH 2624 / FGSC A1156) TaxID=341663 RepID=Q0CME8_ASPTN|nr:uncharacterized protein ATEG_05136 [Aspergillus terreus NIH2624]EAU34205.1 conserved hypothetical protein [Aspergillus terreus NIH2624]
MKFSVLAPIVALALAPSVSAWRVYFYQLQNEQGPYITNSGPGGTGSRCHSVGDLNQKISSMRYYSDNAEGTTRCCIQLFDSPGSLTRRFAIPFRRDVRLLVRCFPREGINGTTVFDALGSHAIYAEHC